MSKQAGEGEENAGNGRVQFERRYSMARMASSLAHALGTPLQVISGRASLAHDATDLEGARAQLAIITRKCSEVAALLQKSLLQLRGPEPELQTADLVPLLRDILEDIEFKSRLEIVWDSEFPKTWSGMIAAPLFAQTLRSVLASALRRTAASLVVTVSRGAQNGQAMLGVDCAWQGALIDPGTLLPCLLDPWQAFGGRAEAWAGALDFLAPYEATRQTGATLSFPAQNGVRLEWPIVAPSRSSLTGGPDGMARA